MKIYGNTIVYAYGGAGGSGGIGNAMSSGSAGGGGGYPAAGIGGGGAGGAGGAGCCAGGGGYTGGTARCQEDGERYNVNGYAGFKVSSNSDWYNLNWNGGGYFEGPSSDFYSNTTYDEDDNIIDNIAMVEILGGFGNQGSSDDLSHMTGNGGVAGLGGKIIASENAHVYAYNGNRYTDGTSYNNGINQCPIYLQRGIKNAIYVYVYGGENRTEKIITPYIGLKCKSKYSDNNELSGYKNEKILESDIGERNIIFRIGNENVTIDMSTQGVGSGAGYIEVSNGTYTVDASMN